MKDIQLIDGRILPLEDIRMVDNWDFYRISSGERLTKQIRQTDKRQYFPSFDYQRANDEAYKEAHNVKTGPLSTNTTKILAGQLLTDPLAAPAEMASNAIDTIKETVTSPKFLIIAGVCAVLLVGGLVVYYGPKK